MSRRDWHDYIASEAEFNQVYQFLLLLRLLCDCKFKTSIFTLMFSCRLHPASRLCQAIRARTCFQQAFKPGTKFTKHFLHRVRRWTRACASRYYNAVLVGSLSCQLVFLRGVREAGLGTTWALLGSGEDHDG